MDEGFEQPTADQPDVLASFWTHWLEEGERPKSVFKLCQIAGVSERDFYSQYGSLDALEKASWRQLVRDTIAKLESDAEYGTYNARQKLLAFYYTYFDIALEWRSRLLLAFPKFRVGFPPDNLKGFREAFIDWVKPVLKEAVDTNEIAERKRINDRYPEAIFGMAWFLTDYNLMDESEGFQDTDALVEKTVNTFFDAAPTQVVDTGFDLLKFLIGRR